MGVRVAEGAAVTAELPPPKEPAAAARAIVNDRWRRDDGMALLRYWRGGFWRWEVTHWAEVERAALIHELYSILDDACWVDEKKGEMPWAPNRHRVGDVVEATEALTFLPETVDPPAWVGAPGRFPAGALVSCANGLLHVSTRTLIPHDPGLFNRVAVPFAYDPDAKAPERWLEFLHSLWADDADSIDALAEYFGYVLSGDTSLHKILLLIGPTRAGKGVIGRVLANLVGTRNATGPTLASLATNFGLAPLIGKSLAVVSDARLGGSGTHLVVERLLTVSGEDMLTIDRKFREPWTGKLGTRFVIISNELPRFGDSSRAIARRFVVLLLRNSWLGQENPRLTRELLEELPGILNWALDGLQRLQGRGYFTEPATSKDAIVALEDLASPVAAFVRDRCVVDPTGEISVDELYRSWRSWCLDEGRDKPGTAQVFGRDLRAVVPALTVFRPRNDLGTQQRHYRGIRSRTHNDRERDSSRLTPPETHETRTQPLSAPLNRHAEVDLTPARFSHPDDCLCGDCLIEAAFGPTSKGEA